MEFEEVGANWFNPEIKYTYKYAAVNPCAEGTIDGASNVTVVTPVVPVHGSKKESSLFLELTPEQANTLYSVLQLVSGDYNNRKYQNIRSIRTTLKLLGFKKKWCGISGEIKVGNKSIGIDIETTNTTQFDTAPNFDFLKYDFGALEENLLKGQLSNPKWSLFEVDHVDHTNC
jgi:hypothetical protein